MAGIIPSKINTGKNGTPQMLVLFLFPFATLFQWNIDCGYQREKKELEVHLGKENTKNHFFFLLMT